MTKKDLIKIFVTAILGVAVTTIFDFIKTKPFLSTLKWIWINIFNIQISLWIIILVIVIIIIALYIWPKTDKVPDWLLYKTDTIINIKWEWVWKFNMMDNNFFIKNLRPICNNCGTNMQVKSHYDINFAECPRCENVITEKIDLDKVEAIIRDNIQRGLYPNQKQ